MRTVNVVRVTRKGNDYGVVVPKGTLGRDIEIGLANAIIMLARHSKITPTRLLRGIESWVTTIEKDQ